MSIVPQKAYDALLSSIEQHAVLSHEDQQACRAVFEGVEAAHSRAILEQEGRTPQHLYFVYAGVLRLYQTNAQGDPVTTFLAGPNSFVTPYTGFIHQQPAQATLETLSPATLLRVRHAALRRLIDTNPRFRAFSLVIFEQAMVQVQHRAQRLATLSAEAHYRHLVETAQPWLALVPVQDIASYLGIHAQSLSRIRRQFST